MNNENAGLGNTENVGFKVITMGREEVDNRRQSNLRPLSLKKLLAWIDGKRIDSRLKAELKKMAAAYPNQALIVWQRNYSVHLAKAQNMLRNKPAPPPANVVELGDEPYENRDTHEEESILNAPDNDFDAGWENPGEDQGGLPAVHPDVPDEGIGGSGPHSKYPTE